MSAVPSIELVCFVKDIDASGRPKKALHSISVTVFTHGTENESNVLVALRQIVPEGVAVDRLEVMGHFGNPMVILTARTEKANDTRHIIGTITTKLPKDELTELREQIPQHLNGCTLVLKFDKQAAARGFLRRGKEDPIVLRAKIAAYPARVQNAMRMIRDLFDDA